VGIVKLLEGEFNLCVLFGIVETGELLARNPPKGCVLNGE
jgi:hypothetical protein